MLKIVCIESGPKGTVSEIANSKEHFSRISSERGSSAVAALAEVILSRSSVRLNGTSVEYSLVSKPGYSYRWEIDYPPDENGDFWAKRLIEVSIPEQSSESIVRTHSGGAIRDGEICSSTITVDRVRRHPKNPSAAFDPLLGLMFSCPDFKMIRTVSGRIGVSVTYSR